jgi:hypothetical protein
MNRQNLIKRLVARKLQPTAPKALCIANKPESLCWAANNAKALCVCMAASNARALCYAAGTSK